MFRLVLLSLPMKLLFSELNLMRRVFTTILSSLLLVSLFGGVVLQDKKDDKKDKDKDKGHQPIVIIIWEPAWPIVFREASQQEAISPVVFE